MKTEGNCHSATACCTRHAGESATFIVMKLWPGEADTRNSKSRSVLFIVQSEKHSDTWLPVSSKPRSGNGTCIPSSGCQCPASQDQAMAHASHPLGFIFLFHLKMSWEERPCFGEDDLGFCTTLSTIMKRPLPQYTPFFFLRIPSKCGKQALSRRQQKMAISSHTGHLPHLPTE